MRELLEDIDKWKNEGKQIALATVVKVYGSAPRSIGAKMVISSKGEFSGSVSAGCVEGAVVEEALDSMENNKPKLLKYGITNDQAFEVGLACGGEIEIYVEPLTW